MPTSLGPLEILVIMVVALIVLGPERLPKAARQIGKAVAEVRHWSSGIQDEVKDAFNTDVEPDLPSAAPPVAAAPPGPYYPDPLKVLPADVPPPEIGASGLPSHGDTAPGDRPVLAPEPPDGPSPD
ncbi:MAG TPA: Sec-independent protein translocase protein TatB [Acidimicrobiales bacterium]|jgi:sec-independent protein translocase protein TatB